MNKITLTLFAACGLLASATLVHAQSFTGLQTGGLGLSTFTAPGSAATSYTVGGTSGGEALIGIDFFTSNGGQLFGMAASGNLYSLSQSSATAYTATLSNTLVGTAGFAGGVTAIDFNPVANRLRVYAGTANYRITPGTGGAITSDGMLAYSAGDTNFGLTPALGAAAYINNFPGSTVTSLFSLDTTQDTLVNNTGTPQFNGLTTIATLTLSGVRFNIVPGNTGFDVTSIGGVNVAYVSSGSTVYTVNLTTGVLTLVGTQAGTALIDVAFVPEPGTYAMLAVGALVLGGIVLRRRRQASA